MPGLGEGTTESKMTTYDIYRDEALMKESVKNYEAAREHLTKLLKEMDPESWELIRIRCPNGRKQFSTLLL